MQRISAVLVMCVVLVGTAFAGEPAVLGWRWDGTGRFPEANAPATWSATQNVIWQSATPDWSNSSPVIVAGRLFVCSEPTTLVCVDIRSGEILWKRANDYEEVFTKEEVARAKAYQAGAKPLAEELRRQIKALKKYRKGKEPKDPAQREIFERLRTRREALDELKKTIGTLDLLQLPPTHKANGHATPTPATDGRYVYVLFGTGAVACYDLEGRRRWIRLLTRPTSGAGHSTSPVLADGKLIVHIKDMVALDARTDAELWRSKQDKGWGTPVVTRIGQTEVIITPRKGAIVRASDGKVLAGKTGGLEYAAPVVHEDVVYFIEKKATAWRLPETAGNTIRPERLWESKISGNRHYASALVHDGLVYAVSNDEIFTVLDASDGSKVYEKKLKMGKGKQSAYASVTLAGGYIHVECEAGTTVVIRPGRTYQEISRNKLEGYRSSPAFLGGRMYLRGFKHVYCIGSGTVAADAR